MSGKQMSDPRDPRDPVDPLDQFVIEQSPNDTEVFVHIRAWRCKRCGYVWPVRPVKGGKFAPACLDSEKELLKLPQKCPGCDSKDWHKDYKRHRKDGRTRKPYQHAGWRRLTGYRRQSDKQEKQEKQEGES